MGKFKILLIGTVLFSITTMVNATTNGNMSLTTVLMMIESLYREMSLGKQRINT